MTRNHEAAPFPGRQPEGNYARGVLQLFSLGLGGLAPDGSLRDGRAQDTYGPQTIAELARVFTGWEFDGFTRADPAWTRRPMGNLAPRYDTGAHSVLGTTWLLSTSDAADEKRGLALGGLRHINQ